MFREQLELHLGVKMTNQSLSSKFPVASFRVREPSWKLAEARDAMFVMRHLARSQYNYEVCKVRCGVQLPQLPCTPLCISLFSAFLF